MPAGLGNAIRVEPDQRVNVTVPGRRAITAAVYAISELIREHRVTLGLRQSEVADWFREWQLTRNLDEELGFYEEAHPDIVTIIRSYVSKNGRYRSEDRGSQGTISKWERGVVPAPDKWLALAEWLELPLIKVVNAINTELKEPASAEGRLVALRKARSENRAIVTQRDELQARLWDTTDQNVEMAAELERLRLLDLDTLQRERDDNAAMLAAANATIEEMSEDIARLAANNVAQAGEVERLAAAVRIAQREMAELRQRVARLPRTAAVPAA